MKVLIDKSFEKDTNEISDKKLLKSIEDCINRSAETDQTF